MITNTRLQELRQTAHQCSQHVAKNEATILEKDFLDLYEFFKDQTDGVALEPEVGKGPHLGILFGR